jgi:hypothetical protein
VTVEKRNYETSKPQGLEGDRQQRENGWILFLFRYRFAPTLRCCQNKYVISHTLKTEVPLMTWQQRADRQDKNVRPSRCDIKIKDEIFPMVG